MLSLFFHTATFGILTWGVFCRCVVAQDMIEVRDCRVSAFETVTLAGERLGILAEVSVQEGDVVQSGQAIAQIRDELARTELATAEKEAGNDIDLRFAKKLSELSTLEYSKAKQLNAEIPGGQPELEVLRLRLAAERALLQIEQASYRLELAELQRQEALAALESYRIRSSIDGHVLQIHKRPGEAIHAGDPVATIGNFQRMRVEGFVPLAQSWRVRPGQPVTMLVAGIGPSSAAGDLAIPGTVSFVDPRINEVSQQVRVWAEVENQTGLLRDGLVATLRIQTGTRANPPQSSPLGSSRTFPRNITR